MPDLGEHTPDPGGDCDGPHNDPIPWPCPCAWRALRHQYRGAAVVVEWGLLAYIAGQLVWAGQRMPAGDAGDIAAQVIRHLEPQSVPRQTTPGVVYGGNSRWPR
jgi:hypothetical protein